MANKRQLAFHESIVVQPPLFFFLLATSLSLSQPEKTRVLETVPELSQYQTDALLQTFLEERFSFNQIRQTEPEQIQMLIKKAYREWQDIIAEYAFPTMPTERTWAQIFFDDVQLRENLSTYQERSDKDEIRENHNNWYINLTLPQLKKQYQYPAKILPRTLSLNPSKKTEVHGLTLPEKIIKRLQKTVIGQDEALRKLAVSLYYHKRMAQINILKSDDSQIRARQMPILFVGATGTGKTHLIKSIAKQYDVNLVMIDASTLVRTGIVGTSLDDIGRMIYEQADKNEAKAKRAVVFFDEFDKLFVPNSAFNYGTEIATQLLTVMEGSAPFPIEYPNNMRRDENAPTSLDSSQMLFILAGSFGIHDKLFKQNQLGFYQSQSEKDKSFNQLKLSTLGLPDELSGRIGQVICLQPLQDEDYARILYHSPTSPFTALKNQLKLVDCAVSLPENVVQTLIVQNKAELAKFGARGLYQAFNALPCITEILLQATQESHQEFVIELP